MNVNSGDTAWLLVCAALVMFMTPGLAFFYGGLVRAKNVVGTMMQSFIALALVTVLWVLIGYTLAFGPDKGGIIGGLDFIGLSHVGAAPSAYAPTVPATAFMVFQMMFAIITPALIAGAFAERMRFSGYLMFIGLWSILVYAPVAHWEWGGGFLGASGVGALDFAGGAVVHANAGAAALATAIYLGKRRGHGDGGHVAAQRPVRDPRAPASCGSAGSGSTRAAPSPRARSRPARSSTRSSAPPPRCSAGSSSERMRTGRVTTIGAATGAVAGLATITPAAGYVPPMAAIAIGLAAGIVCYLAVGLKGRFGYDDSLDVVGVHMVGGIIGVLLTGAFASLAINAAGAAASLAQVGKQGVLAGATVAFSFVVTMVILKVTDVTVGLRVSDEHEDVGLDPSQHGEVAYRL